MSIKTTSEPRVTPLPSPYPAASPTHYRPSAPFVAASWSALAAGAGGFLIGLVRSGLPWTEKGFYTTVLLFALFAVVSLQKSVRDKLDGIPVTDVYRGVCWAGTALAIVLMAAGLWNASLVASEKGFYAMAFLLTLFGAVAVQKNVRDGIGA